MKNNNKVSKAMFELIDRWQTSGIPQKEFCKLEGINYYKFKYWRTHYKKETDTQEPKSKAKVKEQGFIPIEATRNEPLFEGLQIVYPNGVSITCSAPTCKKQLTELINIY